MLTSVVFYFVSLDNILIKLIESWCFVLIDTTESVKNPVPFKLSLILDRRVLDGQDPLLKHNQQCRCLCQFYGILFQAGVTTLQGTQGVGTSEAPIITMFFFFFL